MRLITMPIVLFLCYPLLVHLGVVLRRPKLECIALACLCAGFLYQPLRRGSLWAWLGFLAAIAACVGLALYGAALYVVYIPSLALPGLFLVGFARSLLPGAEPLVTRIAEAMDGALSPERRAYTRGVTWLWVGTTALVMCVTLALILVGSPRAWSLFSNFASYGVLGAVFFGEYVFRRLRFPSETHGGFPAFVRAVVRHRPH